MTVEPQDATRAGRARLWMIDQIAEQAILAANSVALGPGEAQ
jgi:hypothetical protein